MKSNYKRLEPFIQQVNKRNTNLDVDLLLGVSIKKVLMPSIANTVGTNMNTYRIIERSQFAYGPVTSRNGDKISVALLEEHEIAIVSQAYTVFEIVDTNLLLPEYLMMWFRRPEFDRYARFKSHGSARETFDWDEMCDVTLPIPSIEKQKAIVAEYNTVVNRIQLNEQLNEKLEQTAQALYKHWFVDFEFPCLPQAYSPVGQVNLKSDREAVSFDDIKNVCTYKRVGGLPKPDGTSWFVYVLLCENESFYKGITNDVYRRFTEHFLAKGAEWTKTNKPLKVVHWESFASKEEAAKREKDLKTGYGRTWIKRQVEKAGGISNLKTGLSAPKTQLRTAGKMVYNEELEKEIPEGWEVNNLNTFCIEMKNGGTPNRSEDSYWKTNDVPWIKTGEVNNNILIESEEYISNLGFQNSSAQLFKADTVIMAMYGATAAKIAYLKFNTTSNQACCGMSLSNKSQAGYLFYHLLYLQEEIASMAIGGAQPNISKSIIENLKILYPNNFLIEQAKFDLIIKQNEKYVRQIKQLNNLKSLLLAKMTKVEEEKLEVMN